MPTIKRNGNNIILKDGKVSCDCCGEVSCPNVFDTTYWAESGNSSRQVTEEQCDLITLPSSIGASVFAGGTFSGSFTGAYTITVLGYSSRTTAIFSSNVGASGSVNTSGCKGNATIGAASLTYSGGGSGLASLNLSGQDSFGCPANGTFTGIGSLSIRVSYQLVQDGSTWKAYVSSYLSCGGTVTARKTGCINFQMSATGISRNALSTGGSQNFTFLDQSCSTNGSLINNYSATSSYNMNTFVSGSLTIAGNITFTPSAP